MDVTNNQKNKLTLSLNRNVIQKAKQNGINISEITEKLLTAITSEPTNNSHEEVVKAYEAIFDALAPSLAKYDTVVMVGEEDRVLPIVDTSENFTARIILTGAGLYYDLASQFVKVRDVIYCLHEPNRILEDALLALAAAAEKNNKRITELQFALKLIRSLADDAEGKR